MKRTDNSRTTLNRRQAVKLAGASALASVMPFYTARAAPRPIKVGYVSPETGPLAAAGETDDFNLKLIREALKDGVASPNGRYPIEIIVKDSQSNPNRAAEVAGELILQDNIDLMVVGATPENTNPVCDQCELNGVPCISTTAPWQPWFFGRGGDPAKGFQWTYHYFWGVEDVVEVFTSIWKQVPTNKKVGLFLANDGDGNAWGDPKLGVPPMFAKLGYSVFDPGRFQPLQQDFSAVISAYKKEGVEIVCGVPIPPDFKNFWTQAHQQGFRPKVVTMGKAYSVPSAMEALGDIGTGLSQELWWTPTAPFKSSLTGATCDGAGPEIRGGDGAGMARRDRFRALDLRNRRRRRETRQRPDGQGIASRRHHRNEARHDRRPHRLEQGADEECLQDTPRRWPVGQGR